jgi:hypothetical protein
MHNEEFQNVYCSSNNIRVIKSRKWAGNVARMGEIRNFYKFLFGRPEGKRALGIPRHKLEDNTRTYCKGTGCEDVGTSSELVIKLMNFRVP